MHIAHGNIISNYAQNDYRESSFYRWENSLFTFPFFSSNIPKNSSAFF